jgi:uncharacterized protein
MVPGPITARRATSDTACCHDEAVQFDEQAVADALRATGAAFALVHGSRAEGTSARDDSDLDVGAWWPGSAPAAWDVRVPGYVDLVVLNDAPLWLAGRIAQYGRLLFDDDPPTRVRWQADTRLRYLDEIPAVRERYHRRREQLASGRPMVDQERVDRLLDRITADIDKLHGLRPRGADLLRDPTALAATKYYFITAIEGCARVAQHILAAEQWPVAETNADAVRRLGKHGVMQVELAEAVARAVGFRNVLVHEYAEIDDGRVLENLERLADLSDFVSAVARWSEEK